MLVLMCLYISLSNGWFLIKCHLLIRMFLKSGTAEWYVVTKGRIFSALSLFVEAPTSFYWIWLRTVRAVSRTEACFELGYILNEECVLRRRRALPLIKPFLIPGGWQEEKWVYWKVPKSFAFENSGIQEVYFFVWDFSSKFNWIEWWLFATTINSSISFLSTFHSENMSSMYLLHSSGRRV